MNHTLTKKVGPLPVWGWAAAIALGAVVYYWQRHNAGGQVAAGNVTAQPQLDPTAGNFDMPSGLSSGGTGPATTDAAGYPTAYDIADALTSQLTPILATLPYASVPGEPSAGAGGQNVSDFLSNLQTFKDLGFIQSQPAPTTGDQASKAQPHTTPTHVTERVNRKPGNPRAGQVYRVITNPNGHPKGTYHVYNYGNKTAKWVKVK